MIKNLILAGTALLFASCGNDSPAELTQIVLAGTWSGTVTSLSSATTGQMSASFTQTGEDITGSISTPQSPITGGIVEGKLPLGQPGFDLEVKDPDGNLIGQFSGSIAGRQTLIGTFNMWDSTGAQVDTGTFLLGEPLSTATHKPGPAVQVIDLDTGAVHDGTLVDGTLVEGAVVEPVR